MIYLFLEFIQLLTKITIYCGLGNARKDMDTRENKVNGIHVTIATTNMYK